MEKSDTLIKMVAARGDGLSVKQEFVVPSDIQKVQLEALCKRMMYSLVNKWDKKRKEHPNGEENDTQGPQE